MLQPNNGKSKKKAPAISYLKLQELRRRQMNKSQAYVPDEYIKAIDLDPKQLSRKGSVPSHHLDSRRKLNTYDSTTDKAHASDLDKQIYFHYDHDPHSSDKHLSQKQLMHSDSTTSQMKSMHQIPMMAYEYRERRDWNRAMEPPVILP